MAKALMRCFTFPPYSVKSLVRRISTTSPACARATSNSHPTLAELRDRWRDPHFPKEKLQHFIEYDNHEKKASFRELLSSPEFTPVYDDQSLPQERQSASDKLEKIGDGFISVLE